MLTLRKEEALNDESPKTSRPAADPALPGAASETADPVSHVSTDDARQGSERELPEQYRVWRCNGVPIGLHFHHRKRSRRQER